MTWSDKQQEFLNIVAERIKIRDSSDVADGLSRWMHITGGPGTGKTEVIIHQPIVLLNPVAVFYYYVPRVH